MSILFELFGNSLPHHVWRLFHTGAQVLLVDDEHAMNRPDVARSEHAVDFLLVRQVLVLQFQITPDVIGWHHVSRLLILNPSVILKCVLQYPFELAHVLHYLRLGVLVIDRKGQLKAWLTRSLPEVLSVIPGLSMVKLAEASQSEELFAGRR